MTQAICQAMAQAKVKGGAVVNIASIVGKVCDVTEYHAKIS